MGNTSGPVRVRPLAAGDRARWEELWTDYLAFYRTTLPAEVFEAQFARLVAGGDFFALVAESRGRLLGLAHCILHPHGWRLGPVCYLQDLFTDAEARGRGVGSALIAAVYAEADRRGAPHVYWMTEEGNATARALYDRVGQLTPFVRYQRPP